MAIKASLEFLPPVLFAAIRYDIAGILLVVYAATISDYRLLPIYYFVLKCIIL